MKRFIVYDIDGFEKKVLEKYPTATISPGRKTMSRSDEVLFQYFYVEVPGVKDDDICIPGVKEDVL